MITRQVGSSIPLYAPEAGDEGIAETYVGIHAYHPFTAPLEPTDTEPSHRRSTSSPQKASLP